MNTQFEQRLEGLIKMKPYSALTASEKAYVHQTLSAEDYEHFRLILCGSKNGLSKHMPLPSPQIKKNLMAAMRQKRQEQKPVATFLQKVADHQLPVWQAAAMIAGLLFFVMWGNNQMVTEPVADTGEAYVRLVDTIYETQYDTVYKTVPIHVNGKKVNVSPSRSLTNVTKKAPKRNSLPISNSPLYKTTSNNYSNVQTEIPLLADTTLPQNIRKLLPPENRIWNERSIGKTVEEDSALWKLFY